MKSYNAKKKSISLSKLLNEKILVRHVEQHQSSFDLEIAMYSRLVENTLRYGQSKKQKDHLCPLTLEVSNKH